MNYISSNLLTVAPRTSSKLHFLSCTRTRRSEPALVDSDYFAEAIDCRLISPVIQPIEGIVPLISLLLVRVGFKIKISDDVNLLWVRFHARVSRYPDVHGQCEVPEIHCFIPKRIEQDLVLGGRIVENDDGTLDREQVSFEEAGTSATSFKPFSLGYRIDPSHLIWDFLPFDGGAPASTDRLVIAVDAKRQTAFHLSQSLELCATHQRYGTANFEYPTENEIVRAAQPMAQ